MITTILSLGTNLGDRRKNISAMIRLLENILHPPIIFSPLMETEPVGVPEEQEWYCNIIIQGCYDGSPDSLLRDCREIEKTLGRDRKGNLKPRTSDIDILLINDRIITTETFIVPHTQIINRRFCIEGIMSIAPDWIHPVIKKSFREIFNNMSDAVYNQKIRFI